MYLVVSPDPEVQGLALELMVDKVRGAAERPRSGWLRGTQYHHVHLPGYGPYIRLGREEVRRLTLAHGDLEVRMDLAAARLVTLPASDGPSSHPRESGSTWLARGSTGLGSQGKESVVMSSERVGLAKKVKKLLGDLDAAGRNFTRRSGIRRPIQAKATTYATGH